jgi:hypothetical protein
MYRAFNLKLNAGTISKIKSNDKSISDENTGSRLLDSLIDKSGEIKAEKIAGEWFPEVRCDVFISHSHGDYKYAKGLADILRRSGLEIFIDSDVWGNYKHLLKAIDKKYCMSEGGETYDYDKRNGSTAHMHIILAQALTKMIDKCECVFFLQTAQSTKLEGKDLTTYSPWIYHELETVDKIQIKPHGRQVFVEDSSMRNKTASSGPAINYNLPVSRLIDIDDLKFSQWVRSLEVDMGVLALDQLYRICPQSDKS